MEILKSLGEKIAFHKQRSHRIEALSDGVFAIVMTLLVLDIRIPLNAIKTEYGLLISLLQTVPKIFTFILSFLLVGQFWSVLINQFNYIHTADRNSSIIVIFYLLFVSLLPFSASFLSEHLWSRVAIGFYVFNIIIIVAIATLHWLYCWHSKLVQSEENKELAIHNAIMRLAKTALISYSVVAICCFFSSYLALCGTIFLQLTITFTGFLELIYSKYKRSAKYSTSINNKGDISGQQIQMKIIMKKRKGRNELL
jgi:uncharacterized membrane protein